MVSANYDLRLTENWQFHLGDLPRKQCLPIVESHACSKAGGAVRELDMFAEGVSWHAINVPHDWLTEQELDLTADAAGGYKYRGIAWYYVKFKLPETPIERAKLVFDGVLGQCTVYVNGVVAGRNFSGYNRFFCDVDAYLLPGEENEIALYVDARRFEGWWYEGAGLYRPVRIEFRENTCFDRENCFIHSEKSGEDWFVTADLAVLGEENKVEAKLLDTDGGEISKAESENGTLRLPVPEPKLWSPDNPYLYTLSCSLKGSQDTLAVKVGLRTIEWIAEKGMFLNGEHYPVKGICCHQDHAGVGAAVPEELMEYRITTLKQFGINAYRSAHHAPAESLLDICDRLGMLVMVENRHFAASEDVLKQLDALVKMSRNHPSVFLYSLFNEEPWQQEERGRRIAEKMRNRIRLLDATRAITGAQNGGMLEKSNASDVLDVIGANYCLKDYDLVHERTPDKVILGTENCPTCATRGVYHADPKRQVFACYGEQLVDFAESLDETMETVFSRPYVAGCFVWCGFDHRGEPTPYDWPSVVSHWGFHDECGFAKDTAYLLGAWYREDLCVHLLPHWNWQPGETVCVCAFTNGDAAELFLNGKSLGEVTPVMRKAFWQVAFTPGELKVVAKKNGVAVQDQVKTADKPQRLLLTDAVSERVDSRIRVINISAVDENDTLVPDFCNELEITVAEGTLLGVGNGNPNSHHHQKASCIHLFNGRAQVIVTAGAKVQVGCVGLPVVII